MATPSLKEIVDQQPDINPTQCSNEVDWELRKEAWIKQVETLIEKIIRIIDPLKGSKLAYEKKLVPLDELYVGTYQALSLDLFMGKKYIRVMPQGTLIIGGLGRVDMDGPKGGVMFILPISDKQLSTSINNSIGDPTYMTSEGVQRNNKLLTAEKVAKAEWHIVYSKINKTMTPFNEGSFTQALQSII
ncbi:MAG: hypothetical protein HQL93_13995 [Magnetococcales bacterium]|nr:hypothetical protein [Magnetococcales bacterium]